jgi:4-hydroxybenzoate polyprenyltransferase
LLRSVSLFSSSQVSPLQVVEGRSIDVSIRAKIHKVIAVVDLFRPENVLTPALSIVIGALFSSAHDWSGLGERLIILALLHSAATLYNDIQDMDVDSLNHRQGALHDQTVSLPQSKKVVAGLVVAALVLAIIRPHALLQLSLVVVTVALSLLYDLPHFRFSRKPILSIIILGLCYGALPLFSGFIVSGGILSGSFYVLIALWFLQRGSISMLKDYKDAVGDKLIGKETFYLHFGAGITAWVSVVSSIIGYSGVLLWLQLTHKLAYPALGLMSLIAIIGIIKRSKLLRTTDKKELNRVFHRCLSWQNAFELGLIVCLVFYSK